MAKSKVQSAAQGSQQLTRIVEAEVTPLTEEELSQYRARARARQDWIREDVALREYPNRSKIEKTAIRSRRFELDSIRKSESPGFKVDLSDWLNGEDSYGGLKKLEDSEQLDGRLRLTLWENHIAHPSDNSEPKYSVNVTILSSGSGTANIDLILLHAHSKISISVTAVEKLTDQTSCQRRVLEMPATIKKEGYAYQGNTDSDMFKYTVEKIDDKAISELSEIIDDCPCHGSEIPAGVATVTYEVPVGGGSATKTIKSTIELTAGADISLISIGKKLDKSLFKFETEVKASIEMETIYVLPAGHRYISSKIGDEEKFMISLPL